MAAKKATPRRSLPPAPPTLLDKAKAGVRRISRALNPTTYSDPNNNVRTRARDEYSDNHRTRVDEAVEGTPRPRRRNSTKK